MDQIEPAEPMLNIDPALPMLRIDPELPMLRTLRTLNRLPTLPALIRLHRLAKLKMLRTLTALRMLLPPPAARSVRFDVPTTVSLPIGASPPLARPSLPPSRGTCAIAEKRGVKIGRDALENPSRVPNPSPASAFSGRCRRAGPKQCWRAAAGPNGR